jgi:hypothetical protein
MQIGYANHGNGHSHVNTNMERRYTTADKANAGLFIKSSSNTQNKLGIFEMRFIKYAALAIIMSASFASRGETYEVTSSGGTEYVSVRPTGMTSVQAQEANRAAHAFDSTSSSSGGSSGGCYIATAVYGSYDCPQVWTLRRYRDDTLASTLGGRCFIHTYYAISPTLVRCFGQSDWFVNTSKIILDEMVQHLNEDGVSDLPYDDKQW